MFNFRFNTHIYFPESGSRKHFYASEMRAIDFLHKITPRNVIFLKNVEKFFFVGDPAANVCLPLILNYNDKPSVKYDMGLKIIL
jgi:hypothetical protein